MISNSVERDRLEISNTFRKLWMQYFIWCKSYIISVLENSADQGAIKKRLLQNPSDFASELKIFYLDEKVEGIKKLLENHIHLVIDYLDHIKAGDNEAREETRKKTYHNASEIAGSLSEINPYWSKNEWTVMLFDHLGMTESLIDNRLNKRYDLDVSDKIEKHAYDMSDYMTEGLVKQFII
ncbi:MAG: hypothetical protein GX076_02820 [Clostridiales bacterium]|nr:hypothetical protein [Clostridiales bacterium]